MKELQYLNKYFVKYKYSFLIGIVITIVAQIFSLFTPKLISKSFTIIEGFAKDKSLSAAIIQQELISNIVLIIVLMILASSINMIVALLVYIMEKTQTIGVLKALGATNWTIRKIFLYHAVHIIVKGLVIGNIAAILIILLQKYGKIITLNPDNYFVGEVPFYLNFWMFFLINLGTILVATLALIIPTYIISKITPVEAIKFD